MVIFPPVVRWLSSLFLAKLLKDKSWMLSSWTRCRVVSLEWREDLWNRAPPSQGGEAFAVLGVSYLVAPCSACELQGS